MSRARPDAGFTLIEALVALVLLALGAMSLLSAAEGYTARTGAAADRVAARWTTDLAFARTRVGLAMTDGPVEMAGRTLRVTREAAATDDPDLVRVTFRATEAGTGRILHVLSAFVDADLLR